MIPGLWHIVVIAKACFTLIVRPFGRAFLSWVTERRGRETDRRQFHTESHLRKAAVRCSYDYLTSNLRLPQAKVTRLSQDKTIRCTCPALQPCVSRHSCDSLAIKRTVTLR